MSPPTRAGDRSGQPTAHFQTFDPVRTVHRFEFALAPVEPSTSAQMKSIISLLLLLLLTQ